MMIHEALGHRMFVMFRASLMLFAERYRAYSLAVDVWSRRAAAHLLRHRLVVLATTGGVAGLVAPIADGLKSTASRESHTWTITASAIVCLGVALLALGPTLRFLVERGSRRELALTALDKVPLLMRTFRAQRKRLRTEAYEQRIEKDCVLVGALALAALALVSAFAVVGALTGWYPPRVLAPVRLFAGVASLLVTFFGLALNLRQKQQFDF